MNPFKVGDRVMCFIPAVPFEKDGAEIDPGVVEWVGDDAVSVIHDNGSGGMFPLKMVRRERDVLAQLHWQNPLVVDETKFVGQFPIGELGASEFQAWSSDLIERRKSDCPDGWGPMVCTQESRHFTLVAAEAA